MQLNILLDNCKDVLSLILGIEKLHLYICAVLVCISVYMPLSSFFIHCFNKILIFGNIQILSYSIY